MRLDKHFKSELIVAGRNPGNLMVPIPGDAPVAHRVLWFLRPPLPSVGLSTFLPCRGEAVAPSTSAKGAVALHT